MTTFMVCQRASGNPGKVVYGHAGNWIRGPDVNVRRTASALAAAACATVAAAGPASAAPAPAPARELFSVSCVTAKNCLAVGITWGTRTKPSSPLAETWNGKTWRTVGVTLPRGATGGGLSGVSCVTAGRCVAVGGYGTGGSSSEYALADVWNGRAWTPARLPAAGGASTSLDAVSCRSAASCVAAGESYGGPPAAVIESWNGTAWSAQKVALPGDIGAGPTGVSCPSAGSCVAVGSGMYATATASFSGIWNGTSWRDAAVPLPGGGPAGSHLSGVSCTSASRCVAVGDIDSYLDAATPERAAAVTWNGRAWTVTGVPGPGKGRASLFNAVTCLSAKSCVAVGQAGPAGSVTGTPPAGFWNGKSWRLVTAG